MTDMDDLLELAASDNWRDRSRAGQCLAARAGEPTVDNVLLRLLLDPKDTAVTAATAEALLARSDTASWRVFARAWTLAADAPRAATNHIDRLYSCLNGVMYVASMDLEKAATVKGLVQLLFIDEDEDVRSSARELCDLVFEGLG